MKLELGKDDQYQTRDGRPVRIHAVDMGVGFTVLASFRTTRGNGPWKAFGVWINGKVSAGDEEDNLDIILKPVVRECWVNAYDNPRLHRCVHGSLEAARKAANESVCLGQLRILYRDCDIVDGVLELRSWSEK